MCWCNVVFIIVRTKLKVKASNRNEYRVHFLGGGKGGWCVRLTTLQPSRAECLEIWEAQPPGTLRACPGLYKDCFTFLCVCVCVCVCAHAHVCAVFTTVLWFSQLLCKCKGKVALFQAWSGPEGSRTLRFPDFKTFGT